MEQVRKIELEENTPINQTSELRGRMQAAEDIVFYGLAEVIKNFNIYKQPFAKTSVSYWYGYQQRLEVEVTKQQNEAIMAVAMTKLLADITQAGLADYQSDGYSYAGKYLDYAERMGINFLDAIASLNTACQPETLARASVA